MLVATVAVIAGAVAAVLLVRDGRASARTLLAATALSLAYVGAVGLALFLTADAVGAPLPIAAAVSVAPAVLLGAALPNVFGLSPGVASIGWLVPAAASHVLPTRAAAIAVLLVAELWVTGIAGGVLLVLRKAGR
jgi:hypothetical protein